MRDFSRSAVFVSLKVDKKLTPMSSQSAGNHYENRPMQCTEVF